MGVNRHISGYFVGTAITAAVGFLSVPLLLRLLGQTEFGRWALVEPVLLIGSQAALLGANWGVFKLISHDGLDAQSTYRYILRSGWLPVLIVALISALVLSIMEFSIYDSAYLFLVVSIDALLLLALATLRASHSSLAFAGTQVVRGLVLIIVLLAATYGLLNVDVVGSFLLARLATAIAALCVGIWLINRIHVTAERPVDQTEMVADLSTYKEAVRYGLPMLITALLTMILDFAGRYLVAHYLNIDLLAQYVVYTKLVSAVSLLVVTPFSLWWAAERFRRLRDNDGGRSYFPMVASAFLIVLLAAAGSLWLVFAPLLNLYAPGVPNYPEVIALLLLGVVFAGMAYPLNIGLLNEGKTHKNIYAVAIGASAHLTLCLVLIPPLGMLGAATATMVGYFVYMVAFAVLSQKNYFVPFAYRKMFFIAAIAIIALLTIIYILPGKNILELAVRVIAFLFVLGLIGWPVYSGLAKHKINLLVDTGGSSVLTSDE
jgi:O-antigen/teichoic acid export membrane protein